MTPSGSRGPFGQFETICFLLAQDASLRMRRGSAKVDEMDVPLIEKNLRRLGRGVVPKPARFIVTAVYLSCLVLDVVAAFGLGLQSQMFANLACAMRPFGSLASPFFADELLQYAASQCAGAAHEPAISIVLLSAKFALGLLLVPVVCLSVIWRPAGLVALCDTFRGYARDRSIYVAIAKRWAAQIAIMSAVSIACILLTAQRSPQHFPTSLLRKLFLEDGMVLVVPATLSFAMISLIMLAVGRPVAADNQ